MADQEVFWFYVGGMPKEFNKAVFGQLEKAASNGGYMSPNDTELLVQWLEKVLADEVPGHYLAVNSPLHTWYVKHAKNAVVEQLLEAVEGWKAVDGWTELGGGVEGQSDSPISPFFSADQHLKEAYLAAKMNMPGVMIDKVGNDSISIVHQTPWDPVVAWQSASTHGHMRCIQCGKLPHEVEYCEATPNHWNHCSDCGQPIDEPSGPSGLLCWCCSQCECYPCTCEKSHDEVDEEGNHVQKSFRPVAPWAERGADLSLNDWQQFYEDHGDYDWTDAWPALEGHADIDLCRKAADFYLLDALRFGVLNREGADSGAIELMNLDVDRHVIMREADQRYWEVVHFLDRLFVQYVDMACGGELRHHPAIGEKVYSGHRRTAWAQWKLLRDRVGPQAVLDMADMFMDWGSQTGYGGPKWAAAARMLHQRMTGQITVPQWVDRVFALVHNGGLFLNKLGWGCENPKQWGAGCLQSKVLPAHASDGFGTLIQLSSDSTSRLWDEYWFATNKCRVRGGLHAVRNPRTIHRYRILCEHCNRNPILGHQLSCGTFIYEGHKGYDIAAKGTKVDEEDWGDYSWSGWDKPGEVQGNCINMTPQTPITLKIWAKQGLTTAVHEVNAQVGNLGDYKAKPSPYLGKKYAWEPDPDLKFEWWVEVWTSGGHRLLAEFRSGKLYERAEFNKVVVDMGTVLPLSASKVQGKTINWDAVEDAYMEALM